MNEVIEVTERDGIQSVSARELYGKLEIATAFKDWFPRMCAYGFTEGEDFSSFLSESTGGRPSKEYAISIEMAKQICMLQRTDKGKQYRDYFIRLEKAWNTPEAVMARALQFANKTLEDAKRVVAEQKQQLIEQQPKVEFADAVTSDKKSTFDMSGVAQELHLPYGKNTLFAKLREYKILKADNTPYQLYVTQGYFKVYPVPIQHNTRTVLTTKVTQSGAAFIHKILADHHDVFSQRMLEGNEI